MIKRPEPKTHCKRGHEFTPDNTLWQRRNTHRVCRTCKREGEKLRNPRYLERRRISGKLWAKKNPKSAIKTRKRSQVKRVFGITLEEYNTRLLAQSNVCAMCKISFEGCGATRMAPALDHSHSNGSLREFLHNRCNRALGFLEDNPKLCRLAAEYLEKHQENLCIPAQPTRQGNS